MPEITSVETIRLKLHEFAERIDGAVTAAKSLGRIKNDAEKLLAEIQSRFAASEQSLKMAESVRLQLQQVQSDWDALKQKVETSQTQSRDTRALLVSELAGAIQSLDNKVVEAEDRLKTSNDASLGEQAELLKGLDASTKVNAEAAAEAQTTVAATARRLDALLATLQEELRTEVRSRLTQAEELLESEAQRVEKYLGKEQEDFRKTSETNAANHERLLREELSASKAEMQRSLAQHQQATDRQITEFLNKQNALVQNLSQQIDSFNRVTHAQSADLAATNARLDEVALAFGAHKSTTAGELATIAAGAGEVRAMLTKVLTEIEVQSRAIAALTRSSQDTDARLSQTIEKLKQLPLVGGKFK